MKKIISCTAILLFSVLLLVVGYNCINANEMSLFLSLNVDALSKSEGIPVKVCYLSSDESSSQMKFATFCNSSTSMEMLYPCPEEDSWGRIAGSSYCVK